MQKRKESSTSGVLPEKKIMSSSRICKGDVSEQVSKNNNLLNKRLNSSREKIKERVKVFYQI